MVTSNGLSIHSLPERACLLRVLFAGPFCILYFFELLVQLSRSSTMLLSAKKSRKFSRVRYSLKNIHENAAVVTFHVTSNRSGPGAFLSSLWTVKEKELKLIFCYFNSYKKPKAARGERAIFCYSSDVAISWLCIPVVSVYTHLNQ